MGYGGNHGGPVVRRDRWLCPARPDSDAVPQLGPIL